MNGVMPTGNRRLGHGNNQWPGLRLHLHACQQWSSDQTRVSVLIGKQPSADWSSSDETRERSGWRFIGFLAVALLMAVKGLIYEDICKGIHDDENNVLFVTGNQLLVISATCPFVVVC